MKSVLHATTNICPCPCLGVTKQIDKLPAFSFLDCKTIIYATFPQNFTSLSRVVIYSKGLSLYFITNIVGLKY